MGDESFSLSVQHQHGLNVRSPMSYYERTASSNRSHMWFVVEMVRKVRMTPEVASSNLRTYIT
jgi:hypothetical protein